MNARVGGVAVLLLFAMRANAQDDALRASPRARDEPARQAAHRSGDATAAHAVAAAAAENFVKEMRATGHVAPDPPVHAPAPMSSAAMVEVMGMDDAASLALFAFDRLEAGDGDDGHLVAWSAHAWFGGDFDKLWLRSEGERTAGALEHADLELLWSHAIAPFWDGQIGLRHDFGRGPARDWVALGVHGLAPYWFDVNATAYAGEQGRTALRIEVDYDLLLSQRLVLQPRLEFNAYGKSDADAGIGSGWSDASFGVRLRYEIRREFAPYLGIEWTRRFAATADLARAERESVLDRRIVAGFRLWY